MYTDTDIIYYDEERILQAKDFICEWENIKAKRVLEEILEDEPLCEEAHYLLGWIYHHRYDDVMNALDHYSIAVKINPAYYEALADYTTLLNRCGQPKRVVKLAKGVLNAPSFFQNNIHIQLIIAQEKLGKLTEALDEIQELKLKLTEDYLLEEVEKIASRIENKLEKPNTKVKTEVLKWNVQFVNMS